MAHPIGFYNIDQECRGIPTGELFIPGIRSGKNIMAQKAAEDHNERVMDSKILDSQRHISPEGWQEAKRLASLGISQEHRVIQALLTEIKRRDILLSTMLEHHDLKAVMNVLYPSGEGP